MVRRRWWIASAVAAVALAGFALSMPALVRSVVAAEAEQRGFVVEVEGVSFGWGSLWLSGVKVRPKTPLRASARLQHVEVQWTLSGVQAVIIHGGSLQVEATRDELVAARGDVSTRDPEAAAARGPSLGARGLFVQWTPAAEERYVAYGVSLARDSAGRRVLADLLRAELPFGQIEVVKAALALTNEGLGLRTLTAERTFAQLDLDLVLAAGELAAADAAASDVTASPGAAVLPSAVVSPSPAASEPLLDPGAELAPSSAQLQAIFAPDKERGERLRARLRRAAGLLSRRLPEGSQLQLDGVRVRLLRGKSGVSLGPARLELLRGPTAVRFSFVPGFEADVERRLEVSADIPIEAGVSELSVRGGPLALSALGVHEGDLGLTNLDRAQLRVEAALSLADDGAEVRLTSEGSLSNLSFQHPAFGAEPLQGVSVKWRGDGTLRTDGSGFTLRGGELTVGAVTTKVDLAVTRDVTHAVVAADLEVPLGACQEMYDSLPKALVSPLGDLSLGGTFSWGTRLSLDTARLKDMKLTWRMQNDCRFKRIPAAISPERFRGPFTRQVPDGEGQLLSIVSGPGSVDWVPIQEVSPFLEAAVLVSEDGRFWGHSGFDQRAIESSIRQNVEAGRFVRGASTISMQLAKNLYLTREKTLSRKVQEALLTMLLEQELRKDEILELYFNVVELGPGVFGVRRAADYYFRSSPQHLSVAQAFFIASVLPSPTQQYFDEAGYLKPRWQRYIHRLMQIAKERERISEEDLQAGLAEEVRFGVPSEAARAVDEHNNLEGASDEGSAEDGTSPQLDGSNPEDPLGEGP